MVVMCYGVFNGGKWMWFFFVVEIVCFFDGLVDVVFCVVVVFECIYCYLFVYDDLFVMDDDDLCCGQLIVYKKFDEVIVIFVGDVFLIYVFDILVDEVMVFLVEMKFVLMLKFVCVLGFGGMVGGQMFDFQVEMWIFDEVGIVILQVMKIGVFICFVCEVGFVLVGVLVDDVVCFVEYG